MGSTPGFMYTARVMVEFLKSLRGRVIVSLVVTVVVAVLWTLLVKLPMGVRVSLLGGMVYPIWIPVFHQKQVPSRPTRLIVFAGAGGIILVGLLAMLVWLLVNR